MIATKMYLLLGLLALCFTRQGPVQATVRAARSSRDLATQTLSWSLSVFSKSPRTVKKGTKVVFQYDGFHDVWKFPTRAAWAACDFSGATQICGTSVTQCAITFRSLGNKYYGCSVGSHCSDSKMKIKIQVVS